MCKRMILLVSVAALVMVSCEEEHYKGDDCVANQYECIDGGLHECRYVDLDNRITRWEKINLLEQKRICGEQSCEVCKESFNNCTVGAYRCNADGQLQICTIVTESNNRAYINVEYGCDADCQSCKYAVESRCSTKKDKYQCIEYDNQGIVYECAVNNNVTPIVDVYKTTSLCEEECKNCSALKCMICLKEKNDLCKD